MRRETKLLPCPFCGKKPNVEWDSFYRNYIVQCVGKCWVHPVARGATEKKSSSAIRRWNTRAAAKRKESR